MCDGCITDFTTYFGTGILGMWITWGNTATDSAGTVASDTELQIDFDLRLYAADLTSESGGVLENTQTLQYYVLWTNPYEEGSTTGNNNDMATIAINAIVDDQTITNNNESTGGTVDTEDTFSFAATSGYPTDANGSAYPVASDISTALTADTVNDVTSTTAASCTETWKLASAYSQCVRIQSSMTMLFKREDTNSEDFDLAYRPFDVGAGWNVGSAVAAPTMMNFSRQTVDYARFLEGEPESDYNGAYSVTLGSALVAAILSQLW